MTPPERPSRRTVLAGLAILAGCTGGDELDDARTRTVSETDRRHTVSPTPTATSAPDPIPLGYVFPLNGTFERFGQAYARAAELAVEDLNEAGGPLGRPVELHAKDNKSNGSLHRDRYEKLVEAGVLGVVLFPPVFNASSVERRVERNRVVEVFNLSAGMHDVGHVDGTKYVAQTGHDLRADETALATCLADDAFVGADTVSFLRPSYRDEATRLAAQTFDGTTLTTVAYDPHRDDGDYSDVLEAVFADDPDAIGCVPHRDAIPDVLRQAVDRGHDEPWSFTSQGSLGEYRRLLGSDAPRMYHVRAAPERGPGWEPFSNRHLGASISKAPEAYDATFLLGLAIQRAGDASSRGIAENVRSVSRSPGRKVTVGEFDIARELLEDGQAVHYLGASHAMDLSSSLTPFVRYEVREASADRDPARVGILPPDRLRPPS